MARLVNEGLGSLICVVYSINQFRRCNLTRDVYAVDTYRRHHHCRGLPQLELTTSNYEQTSSQSQAKISATNEQLTGRENYWK